LSGCTPTLPKNLLSKLLKMLSTAFKTWPLEQLYLGCVWDRFIIFYIPMKPNHLLSPNANWDWWEFAHRCQWTKNNSRRAPPATNFRN
jgi:hypothetical protein